MSLSQKSQPTAPVPRDVGYNHYVLSIDLAVATETIDPVTALCGATWALDTSDVEPVGYNATLPRDIFAAVELPTCPDCEELYAAKEAPRRVQAITTTPITFRPVPGHPGGRHARPVIMPAGSNVTVIEFPAVYSDTETTPAAWLLIVSIDGTDDYQADATATDFALNTNHREGR